MKKQKTKKCPVCKGTGKVKIDDSGLSRIEKERIVLKMKEWANKD